MQSDTFESIIICLLSGKCKITSGRWTLRSAPSTTSSRSYSCPFVRPERSSTLSRIISPQFPVFHRLFSAFVRLLASSLTRAFNSVSFRTSSFKLILSRNSLIVGFVYFRIESFEFFGFKGLSRIANILWLDAENSIRPFASLSCSRYFRIRQSSRFADFQFPIADFRAFQTTHSMF